MKWSIYNQSPLRRGEIILGFDVINNWDTELKEMIEDKVGEPFNYLNTFLLLLDISEYTFICHTGILKVLHKGMLKADYLLSLIHYNKHRRINRLNIKIKDMQIATNSKTNTLPSQ
jgi:triphosphoribosyl-dephospho-CoA synthetase